MTIEAVGADVVLTFIDTDGWKLAIVMVPAMAELAARQLLVKAERVRSQVPP